MFFFIYERLSKTNWRPCLKSKSYFMGHCLPVCSYYGAGKQDGRGKTFFIQKRQTNNE